MSKQEVSPRGYFTRFFGFARAFLGFGGEFSIVRSKSSVLFSPSSRGSKSSDSGSCLLGVCRSGLGGLVFIIAGV
jgi:hypothetical protein